MLHRPVCGHATASEERLWYEDVGLCLGESGREVSQYLTNSLPTKDKVLNQRG